MAVRSEQISLQSTIPIQGSRSSGGMELALPLAGRLGMRVLDTDDLVFRVAHEGLREHIFDEPEEGPMQMRQAGLDLIRTWLEDKGKPHFEIVRSDQGRMHLVSGRRDLTVHPLSETWPVSRGKLEIAAGAVEQSTVVRQLMRPIVREGIIRTGGGVLVTDLPSDEIVPEARIKYAVVAQYGDAAQHRLHTRRAVMKKRGKEMDFLALLDRYYSLHNSPAGATLINTSPYILRRGGMDELADHIAMQLSNSLPETLNEQR